MQRPDSSLQVIDLVDTGVGADTTKSDGIYSRYFLDISDSGRYTVVCVVNSTESSYIDDGMGQLQHTATGDFNRVQSGGTFRVISKMCYPLKIIILFLCRRLFQVEKPVEKQTYSYPPNRVTDLKVVAMEVENSAVTIEWTAPGQELDSGTGIR